MDLSTLTLLGQKKAEQLFAAAAFINADYAIQKCGWMKPDWLCDERVRRFWINLNGEYRGKPDGAAMEAGCYLDMLDWQNEVASAFSVESYANEIRRRAYLISLDPHFAKLMDARRKNDVETVRTIITGMYNETPQVMDKIPDAGDVHTEFVVAIDDDTQYIKTYIPNLDRGLEGLDRGTLTLLASRPSMGKSTLSFQIARNNAGRRLKVVYFALEQKRVALWRKAACGITGIDWREVKGKRISPQQRQALIDESASLAEAYGGNLLIDDRTFHTTESIWQVVASTQPDLVVVDVIAECKDRHEREVLRLGSIAGTLKRIAKEQDCHVIGVHHVGREVTRRDNKEPTMADLRESGELEQKADYVIFLHSDDYYNQASVMEWQERKTDAIVAKNRDGVMNIRVGLKFDLKAQWFEPVER